mmetsp:Transcript_87942/g.283970  ORF Transcript_87942/g.283970 Transcript_87942/m.283970 type:complete len:235 (+) Transcript_87942:833-1537(+)
MKPTAGDRPGRAPSCKRWRCRYCSTIISSTSPGEANVKKSAVANVSASLSTSLNNSHTALWIKLLHGCATNTLRHNGRSSAWCRACKAVSRWARTSITSKRITSNTFPRLTTGTGRPAKAPLLEAASQPDVRRVLDEAPGPTSPASSAPSKSVRMPATCTQTEATSCLQCSGGTVTGMEREEESRSTIGTSRTSSASPSLLGDDPAGPPRPGGDKLPPRSGERPPLEVAPPPQT